MRQFCLKIVLVCLSFVSFATTASAAVTGEQFFNYLENLSSVADVYLKDKVSTQNGVAPDGKPFTYRYYPKAGNYVATDGKTVYVYGTATNWQLVNAGELASFDCPINNICKTPEQIEIDKAFAELNRLRVEGAGAQAVTWNEQAAKAAQNHANYLSINNEVDHSETPGKPGFTGETLGDRLKFVGISGYPIGSEGISFASPSGIRNLQSFIGAPYHWLTNISDMEEVGIGHLANTSSYTVVFLTKKNQKYNLPAQTIRMFPCNKVSNILYKSIAEERPTPISGRSLYSNPIGTPIYLIASSQANLVIDAYEVRNMQTGEVAPIAKVLGTDNSPEYPLPRSQKVLLPDAPLAQGSLYRATVSGANDGIPFTKSCEFITGTDTSLQ